MWLSSVNVLHLITSQNRKLCAIPLIRKQQLLGNLSGPHVFEKYSYVKWKRIHQKRLLIFAPSSKCATEHDATSTISLGVKVQSSVVMPRKEDQFLQVKFIVKREIYCKLGHRMYSSNYSTLILSDFTHLKSSNVVWFNFMNFIYTNPALTFTNLTFKDVSNICKKVHSRVFSYKNNENAMRLFEHMFHNFGRSDKNFLVFKGFLGHTVSNNC